MTSNDRHTAAPIPADERRLRLFAPILAGANLRDRLVACLGALIGVCGTAAICGFLFRHDAHLPLIVAPVGASAVLLFAIPASPLAQPWPIIGGSSLSAFIGLMVAEFVPDPVLALGLALALALAVMSLARCLHPPGGASALIAAMGGPLVENFGYWFPIAPVALNATLLVGFGILFHKLSRTSYPHRPTAAKPGAHRTQDVPAPQRVTFRPEDVDAALATIRQTFDIDRGDLEHILRQVELQTVMRSHGDLLCRDIMSRDVISVRPADSAERARGLLMDHNVRTLPVVDEHRVLQGAVGLRELMHVAGPIAAHIADAATAAPEQPAMSLLPMLTDGRKHAVIVVDDERHLLGLISQTDLLAAVARHIPMESPRR